MNDTSKHFKENSYVVIKDFLKEPMLSLHYNYVKLLANRNAIKFEELNEKYDKYWDGEWEDPQAIGSYSHYGDPLMDTLLCQSLNSMQEITGLKLTPTYSYFRLYTMGDELKHHKDRPSCEISTTLCLGTNHTNLDYDYNWNIYMQKESGEKVNVSLNPGDMVVYRGCDLWHGRPKFEGLNQAQVFLHYNEIKEGQHNNFMDDRPMFGLPKLVRYQY